MLFLVVVQKERANTIRKKKQNKMTCKKIRKQGSCLAGCKPGRHPALEESNRTRQSNLLVSRFLIKTLSFNQHQVYHKREEQTGCR